MLYLGIYSSFIYLLFILFVCGEMFFPDSTASFGYWVFFVFSFRWYDFIDFWYPGWRYFEFWFPYPSLSFTSKKFMVLIIAPVRVDSFSRFNSCFPLLIIILCFLRRSSSFWWYYFLLFLVSGTAVLTLFILSLFFISLTYKNWGIAVVCVKRVWNVEMPPNCRRFVLIKCLMFLK